MREKIPKPEPEDLDHASQDELIDYIHDLKSSRDEIKKMNTFLQDQNDSLKDEIEMLKSTLGKEQLKIICQQKN